MSRELLFLGTGGSLGTPVIGCRCTVCQSKDLKDRRDRPGALLRLDDKIILIDVGTDFRRHALNYQIDYLDGIILTHTHQDHIGGVDDLRPYFFQRKEPIECLLSKKSLEDLKSRYFYIFNKEEGSIRQLPLFNMQVLEGNRGKCQFQGKDVSYFTYKQMGMEVTGFRFDDFAYVTDIKEFDESIYEDLKGVKTLVLSALRNEPSPMHLTVAESVAFGVKLGVKRLYLTHIAHELEHASTQEKLPNQVFLAYDGLKIKL